MPGVGVGSRARDKAHLVSALSELRGRWTENRFTCSNVVNLEKKWKEEVRLL